MFPQRPFLYPFFLFLPWSSSPTSGCMFPPPCSAGFSLLTFSTAPASPALSESPPAPLPPSPQSVFSS
uniref:Secreted protein n=1 Tax=Rhinopithecus bieti TaxID=61621 RepID=A0A2K6ML27_RHIBE